MSNYLITDSLMEDIADAIRAKTGGSALIQGSDFPSEIANIPTGGTQLLTLTPGKSQANGTVYNRVVRDWDFNNTPLLGACCMLSTTSASPTMLPINRRIRNFTVPDGKISPYAFYMSRKLDIGTSLPSNVTEIGDYAFNMAYTADTDATTAYINGTKVVAEPITSLPSGLTTVGNNAFNGCVKMFISQLPSTLRSIGTRGFYNCSGLAITELPDELRTINPHAFYACTGITQLKLGTENSNLTELAGSTFSGCSNLAKIFIPSTITVMGSSNFNNCTKLKKIFCGAASKPTGWPSTWYSGTPSTAQIIWGATVEDYEAG